MASLSDSEEEPMEIVPAKGKKAPVKAVPVKAKSTAEDEDEEEDDDDEEEEEEDENDEEEDDRRKGKLLGNTEPSGKCRTYLMTVEDTQGPPSFPDIWGEAYYSQVFYEPLQLSFPSPHQDWALMVQTSVFHSLYSVGREKGGCCS